MARRDLIEAWHVSALQMALAGHADHAIAARLSIPGSRVKRFLRGAWAQRELKQFNDAVLEAAAKTRVDPIVKFNGMLNKAMDKLHVLLDAEDEKVQFLAACRIIDNNGYTPIKRVHITEDDVLRGLTPEQLREVQETGRLPAGGPNGYATRPVIDVTPENADPAARTH